MKKILFFLFWAMLVITASATESTKGDNSREGLDLPSISSPRLHMEKITEPQAYAREYRPFVEEGKTWNMHFEYATPLDDVYGYDFKYYIEGDTIIRGVNCKKFYAFNEDNTGKITYLMSLYETERTVYAFPAKAEKECVLYNFNGIIGDNVTIAAHIGLNPWSVVMRLNDIKQSFLHGSYWQVFQVNRVGAIMNDEPINDDEDWGSGLWIEGIGSELGPLNTWGFGAISSYKTFVNCELNGDVILDRSDIMSLKSNVKGDLNGDGRVDVEDVNALVNIILKLDQK